MSMTSRFSRDRTIIVGDLLTRQVFSGNKNINVPVYLTFASPTPVTIDYQTLDGTTPNAAAGGTDYVSKSGTLPMSWSGMLA